MVLLWTFLSFLGLLVAFWYFAMIFNPYGWTNCPMILRKPAGHVISWLLILGGVASAVGLFISLHNYHLFFKVLIGIFLAILLLRLLLTPFEMPYKDIYGIIYSQAGLRFGGFRTKDFLTETETLEQSRFLVRERIIAEAHFLASWLHFFPEIAFFIGIVLVKDLLVASMMCIASYLFEIARFYLFGSSLFLSYFSRYWSWLRFPLFVFSSIIFWSESRSLSIILILFLIFQVWLQFIITVGLLPLRLIIGRVVYKRLGGYWHNMEGMALSLVIGKWQSRLRRQD